jgi:hypothetical protein
VAAPPDPRPGSWPCTPTANNSGEHRSKQALAKFMASRCPLPSSREAPTIHAAFEVPRQTLPPVRLRLIQPNNALARICNRPHTSKYKSKANTAELVSIYARMASWLRRKRSQRQDNPSSPSAFVYYSSAVSIVTKGSTG